MTDVPVTDEACPTCRGPIYVSYGLAGGGIGTYLYCDSCGIIDKFPDPELSTDAEMESDRKRREQ